MISMRLQKCKLKKQNLGVESEYMQLDLRMW
jgi:hypothetical protein